MKSITEFPVAVLAVSILPFLVSSPVAYGYYVPDGVAVQEQDGITFVSGGIGDEERQAMLDIRRDYNLHIMSSGKDGAFVGNTKLIIYDRIGDELVRIDAEPLFYAKLPIGKYTIVAESEGDIQRKTVNVTKSRTSQLHFIWQ